MRIQTTRKALAKRIGIVKVAKQVGLGVGAVASSRFEMAANA
jgi:hypothetical protein